MIERLTPVNAIISFQYICPHCGFIFFKSPEEIKQIGKEVCVCNKLLYLQRMELVVITPKYEVSPPKKQMTTPVSHPKHPDLDNSIVSTLVDGIVRLGSQKSEAKQVVATYIRLHPYSGNLDEYFTEMVRSWKSLS
jgi:hypothetical protein